MDYQTFVDAIKYQILEYLPAEYRDAKVEVTKQHKVNRQQEGIIIRKGEEQIAPVIYLQQYYEEMQEMNLPFEKVCRKLAKDYLKAEEQTPAIKIDINKEILLQDLFAEAINYERNRKWIKNIPYLKVNDLAIIPRAKIGREGTILITDDLIKYLKLDGDLVLAAAIERNPQTMRSTLRSMEEILDIMGEGSMERPQLPLYVLSNEENMFGASLIANKRVMDQAAAKLGGNFYVLPSSIHEGATRFAA